MAKIREKHTTHRMLSELSFEENKAKTFARRNEIESSYRVYEDGKVGICYHCGKISDEDGFAAAQAVPDRARPYEFLPENGGKRSRDKTECSVSDRELMDMGREYMEYLATNYPDFTFAGSVSARWQCDTLTNDLGTDFSNTDYAIGVGFRFKHKDSRDLMDGAFEFNMRKPDDGTIFRTMADLYLANYATVAEIPEEIILDMQYYGQLGVLASELNAEALALGTSRLSGKIGEKVFADDFSVEHDAGDQECWFTRFWDGEGSVLPDDKLVLIENGVIKTGYSDKRVAAKYNVPYTKSAGHNYTDLPTPGGLNLRIRRSDKTVRELLNGRYAVIPMNATGSPIDAAGDTSMVINTSLLWDGERVVGRLPEFRAKVNCFDMFGKDFLGVGSDDPIYHDKQILLRVHRVE